MESCSFLGTLLPPFEGRLGSWELVIGGTSALEPLSENSLQDQDLLGSEIFWWPGIFSLPRSPHLLHPPPSQGLHEPEHACHKAPSGTVSVRKERHRPGPPSASGCTPTYVFSGPPLFGAHPDTAGSGGGSPNTGAGIHAPLVQYHFYSREPIFSVFMTPHSMQKTHKMHPILM